MVVSLRGSGMKDCWYVRGHLRISIVEGKNSYRSKTASCKHASRDRSRRHASKRDGLSSYLPDRSQRMVFFHKIPCASDQRRGHPHGVGTCKSGPERIYGV